MSSQHTYFYIFMLNRLDSQAASLGLRYSCIKFKMRLANRNFQGKRRKENFKISASAFRKTAQFHNEAVLMI